MAGIRDPFDKPLSLQGFAAPQRTENTAMTCHVQKCHDVARFA
jgi:hypothetical protein